MPRLWLALRSVTRNRLTAHRKSSSRFRAYDFKIPTNGRELASRFSVASRRALLSAARARQELSGKPAVTRLNRRNLLCGDQHCLSFHWQRLCWERPQLSRRACRISGRMRRPAATHSASRPVEPIRRPAGPGPTHTGHIAGGTGTIDTITNTRPSERLARQAALPSGLFASSCNDDCGLCIIHVPAASQTLIYERILVDRS